MISELNDEEILEFLMTSEFETDFSPDELKYLLVKFRYFYRLIHGKYEMSSNNNESISSLYEEKISIKTEEINKLLAQIQLMRDEVDSIKNRKLTLKERISGKINLNNEN
jgi:hypothetical protein